ncbi:CTR1 suppressor protein [Lindgomyces ingoldianus]|uniref:CTR1 suppressor protein n=1 Tax=Lindgomyces ingoldianus TaxID=673940 RepID=A0ACB6QES3_9PLEO|nr:CTR1 suppressor protein [Lindgomyces ingoldianus]KAF2465509.1 CTR1 suppressor protein [Lindgomyces ingoldianus]
MAKKKIGYMNNYVYDAFLWVFSILVDLFFREVHPRSSWKVPKHGPVLFVCAPHANQFVDPLILMRVVKKESDRRIHFLIAEKSMKRRFIGAMAGLAGSVPVGRAMDSTKSAVGKIYLPDPVNDPCLIRGIGTDFESKDFQAGGTLSLPPVNNLASNAEIQEILGPEELRLKRPFKGGIPMQQLTGRDDMTEEGQFVDGAEARKGPAPGFEGINFKVAPKMNQREVYDAVHEVLHQGGSVGIFPEGGSHDRTELLPLKAGVAIMALGTMESKPDCNLQIIPVGMNYFHAHKFRSRAVIEFGTPVDVPMELVEKYSHGGRREAIGTMLEMVRQALVSVTVQTPDYDTLMLIQAVRRLYNPKGKKLPLPMVVELNRRLVQGYAKYKDDPRIVDLKKSVQAYNKRLLALNLRDHQVQYAKMNIFMIMWLLVYRTLKLMVLSIFVIPGFTLFAFVFFCGKVISIKKSKEALAASSVKIQARDVMATWKLLVAIAIAPITYTFWIVIFTYWCHRNRVQGYIPEWVPLKLFVLAQVIVFPTITYAALRFGEVGMDIAKSLWPLVKMLSPWSNNELIALQKRREILTERVNTIINTLGPEMFPDFDSKRIITDPFSHSPPQSPGGQPRSETYSFPTSPTSEDSPSKHLPRNESFRDLSNTDFFSTRPSTPKKSRSRHGSLGGFSLKAFSTLDGKDSLDAVSKKIRDTMRERGRRRSSTGDGWEMGSGTTTPGSEELEDALQMSKKDK